MKSGNLGVIQEAEDALNQEGVLSGVQAETEPQDGRFNLTTCKHSHNQSPIVSNAAYRCFPVARNTFSRQCCNRLEVVSML
jgi:hypothetical protein